MKHKKMLILILIVSLIIIGVRAVYALYPTPLKEYVMTLADKYEIDYLLIYAIIQTETHFDTNAVSRSNAKGLMQIMDQTGNWAAEELDLINFEPQDLFDPFTNIKIGTWYISKLIKQYGNDIDKALMAYNAGSGNVAKWLSDTRYSSDGITVHTIPFEETRNYIIKVNFHYTIYKFLY
ncbi:MAG: lytic transglycosylase [Epulopiscium sp. Nuni2H_MBin003]|nr:MAG: lytic transglycosylase [Epulopiscium sp. Nuni2H_MBin003]